MKTAFLHLKLDEDIYLELRGLKHLSRMWNKVIKNFGFKTSKLDPCIYVKASNSNILILAIFIDHILMMFSDH